MKRKEVLTAQDAWLESIHRIWVPPAALFAWIVQVDSIRPFQEALNVCNVHLEIILHQKEVLHVQDALLASFRMWREA